jgi:hypothetical protein
MIYIELETRREKKEKRKKKKEKRKKRATNMLTFGRKG